MEIVQRGNYLIYFDDVRVDPYVVNWSVNTGLFANETSASVVMYRTDAMDNWKAYLTQVRIFGENPFTKKFTMLFEGEIMNRSWNENQSDMGKVTLQCKGFYHWLDIPVPLGIQNHESLDPKLKFIYEAQNINIEEVATLLMTNAETLMLDKNIEEVIKTLFDKMTIGYYDVSGAETTFAFAHLKERFKVMVDVLQEFREAGFLDLFSFTEATQIDSFFVYLNQVLSQLMFEFYQDRDGAFRIKTPSWADALLKAQVIDSSIVGNVSGFDDWQNEPTRVLAIGGETQIQQSGSGTGGSAASLIPMGLYIGDPQNPETEEYYSQQVEIFREQYGVNYHDLTNGGAVGPGESLGTINGMQWFDNLSGQPVSSGYGQRWGKLHAGTDYPFSTGTQVYNIGTFGTVSKVGTGTTQGNYVHIQQRINGLMYEFRYYHLDEYLVSNGQSVAPGELIARSGNTGTSTTGAHLHFEVLNGGVSQNPVTFLANMKSQMVNIGNVQREITTNGPKIIRDHEMTYSGSAAPAMQNQAAAPSWISKYKPESWLSYETTSYNALCPPLTINGRYFQGCTGITATGWDVKDGSIDHRVIAVDPAWIPLHSIVEIEGLGLFNAQDTGGAIKGLKIDVLSESYEKAIAFGRKSMRARIIRRGKGGEGEIIPKSKIGANPTSVGGSANGFSSPYANVDSSRVVATGFKLRVPSGDLRGIETPEGRLKASTPSKKKGVKYPFGKALYTVPTNSSHLSTIIKGQPGGLDSNIIAAVIMNTSNWREKFSSDHQIGIMGLSKVYAEGALAGHNLLVGTTAIDSSSLFLAEAIAHFGNKISFGLAAYYMGNYDLVEKVTEMTTKMDFTRARDYLPAEAVRFVDNTMSTLASFADGDYIEGDPHVSFGSDVHADDTEVPDYEAAYKPRLSAEESRYKINLIRVQQGLIRNDSPVLQSEASITADELIYRFAKYTMQLHRAKTHNVNVSLVTCLPFLRVGMNAWLEPTRKDVVFYVTSIAHQGSFSQGCYTQVNGGFVRDPATYQDIDESIFVGEKRADSSIYGEVLGQEQMKTLRAELNSMHSKDSTGEAADISVLNKMYSSMNLESEYTTKWNLEYTFDEVAEEIKATYEHAPNIVGERKALVAKVISDSEDIFLKKLMFTR